jgi:hypothetical protein
VATRQVVTAWTTWTAAPAAGEHTVRGLDGQAYEIDLTDVHAQEFRELLAPYTSVGRRLVTRSGRPCTRIDLDTRTTGAGRRVRRRRG